jgi:hypothetical protein
LAWEENGELLGLMTFNGFDFFVTVDKNLQHQQSLAKFSISIFLLVADNNRRETLQKLVDKIKDTIKRGNYSKLTIIS